MLSQLKKLFIVACLATSVIPAAARAAEPTLATPAADLRAALHCTGNLKQGREPVLLVHGTSVNGTEAWVAPNDFGAVLRARGLATCYVDLPQHALGDLQVSAEYVVAAIRTVSRRARRPIAVYAHSQGGLLTRWALTYWPSLRRKVADAVSAAGSHHGTDGASLKTALEVLCGVGCPPAFLQQKLGSELLGALNNGRDETPGPTAWTTIRSTDDDIVQPADGSKLEGATNVLIQAVCPGRTDNHEDTRFDSVSYAALIDALRHKGPAKPRRFAKDVCARPYAPGLDPERVKASQDQAKSDSLMRTVSYAPQVREEPAVRSYAR